MPKKRKTRNKKRRRKRRTRRRARRRTLRRHRYKKGGDLVPDGEGGYDNVYVSGMPDELVVGNNYHTLQLCPPGGTIGTKGNFKGGKENWRVAFCNEAKDKGVCCPPNFTCAWAYPDGEAKTMECKAPPDRRPGHPPRIRDASGLRRRRRHAQKNAERLRRQNITREHLARMRWHPPLR